MDDLIDAMQHLSTNNDISVTEKMLSDIILIMRMEKVDSIPIADLIRHIVQTKTNENKPHNAPRTTSDLNSSISDDESDISASFIFHSPSKPITPFNVKKTRLRSNRGEEFEKGPFTVSDDTIPIHKLNINEKSSSPSYKVNNDNISGPAFPNFYATARSSIPTKFESPAGTKNRVEAEEEDEEKEENINKFPKPVSNNSSPEEFDSGKEKAWFWGNDQAAGTEEKNSGAPDTGHFSIPTNGFTIGSGVNSANKTRKGKPASTKLHSKTKDDQSTNPFNPTFHVDLNQVNATETVPDYQPSFAKPFTGGGSENIPVFPTTEPIPTIPKSGFFTQPSGAGFSGTGDLEDDDDDDNDDASMNIDNPFSPPSSTSSTQPNTFSSTTTTTTTDLNSTASAKGYTSNTTSRSSAKTEVPPFTFTFNGAPFHFGIDTASTSEGSTTTAMPTSRTETDAALNEDRENAVPFPSSSTNLEEDLKNLEDKMFQFNLGSAAKAAERNVPRSARKVSARKKETVAQSTPERGDASSNSASSATVDSENVDSNYHNTESGIGGDTPPSWWTKSVSQSQPNTARNSSDNSAKHPANKADSITPERPSPRTNTTFPTLTPRKENKTNTTASPNGRYSTASNQQQRDSSSNDESLIKLAETYCAQGKELYSLGMYERALEAYTNCLKVAPPSWIALPTVLGNRAAVNFMLNRYIESVNDCDDALAQDTKLIKLYLRKGKSLIKLGHLQPAEKSFLRVIDLQLSYFQFATESERKSFDQLLESTKLEAKAGFREIETLNDYLHQLIAAEAKQNNPEVIKVADKILSKSVYHRISQIAKANALLELQKYDEAKGFMEEITLKTPMNIQTLYSHSKANFPAPKREDLLWMEGNKSSTIGVTASLSSLSMVLINIEEIVKCFLCMGSELAAVYLTALKNIALNRQYSADIMNKLVVIGSKLDSYLTYQEKDESWKWLKQELSKLNEFVSIKNLADQQFKTKNFQHALANYTKALKIDSTARRWSAILFCNRAATYMSLSNYQEAVQDCHNAIQKDSDYSRAYLRRARAYRAMNKFAESTRDYRRYLCSDPVPSDFQEIQKELDEMNELKMDFEYQQSQQPSQSSSSKQSTSRPSSAKPTTSTNTNTNTTGAAANNSSSASSSSSRYSNTFNGFENSRKSNPGLNSTFGNTAAGGSGKQTSGSGKSNSSRYYQRSSTNFNDFSGGNSNSHGYHNFGFDSDEEEEEEFPSSNKNPYTHYSNSSNSNSNSTHSNNHHSSSSYARPQSASSSTASGAGVGSSGVGGSGSNSGKYGNTTGNGSGASSTNTSSKENGGGPTVMFSLTETDHYTVLGIDTAANEREIKLAYRKLALQFHPDKNKDDHAEERFKLISLAYSILSDKTTRRQFDLTRPISRAGSRKY